jgi:hypothetical protein
MTSAERALLVARVLEVHPQLAELVPQRHALLGRPRRGTPSKRSSSAGLPGAEECGAHTRQPGGRR